MTLPPDARCNPVPTRDRWLIQEATRQAAALTALPEGWKGEELDRLLAEDSPRGEEIRRLRDLVRTEFFGLEPPCPECEEDESGPPEPVEGV